MPHGARVVALLRMTIRNALPPVPDKPLDLAAVKLTWWPCREPHGPRCTSGGVDERWRGVKVVNLGTHLP